MKASFAIPEDLFDTIERYYNKELSSLERKDFERLLQLDNDFKMQVTAAKYLLLGVELQSISEALETYHETILKTVETAPKKEKGRLKTYKRFSLAAALIIAFGSIYFFSTPRNERLYTETFSSYPAIQEFPNTLANTNFKTAMHAYNAGNYATAIKQWKTAYKNKPNNDTLNFYLAVAYLANEQEAKAIPILEKTVQTAKTNSSLIKEAHYYLALAYLKKGHLSPTKKHLKLSGTHSSLNLLSKIE